MPNNFFLLIPFFLSLCPYPFPIGLTDSFTSAGCGGSDGEGVTQH